MKPFNYETYVQHLITNARVSRQGIGIPWKTKKYYEKYSIELSTVPLLYVNGFF
jgi:hypothetical protein